MPIETTKTKKIWSQQEWSFLTGKGIDIGCGPDPLRDDVQPFDLQHGDANRISEFVTEKKDFVFSSHCLEHMLDPKQALKEWYKILKPGGYLFIIVPDEDLYEQGVFPSRFNSDHKWTFTISKAKSWSDKSINVLDLVREIDGELISVKLQDHNYDYRIFSHKNTWWSRKMWRHFERATKNCKGTEKEIFWSHFFWSLGASFDQTNMGGDRLAQIQFIIRKPLSAQQK